MADIIAHPRAQTERVVQTRIRGRLPKAVPSLRNVRREKRWAEYQAQQITEKIARYNEAIGLATSYVHDCRLSILKLSEDRKGVAK